jgi:cell division transport system permease protein
MNKITRHAHTALESLGRLYRTPTATLMTILVIGLSLALPMLLWVSMQNVKRLSGHWEQSLQISLYLHSGLSQSTIDKLTETVKNRPDITSVRYVSPEAGLQEFQQRTHLTDALAELPENPLPPVLEVFPNNQAAAPENMKQLIADLHRLPEVESAQYDLAWVQRLASLLMAGKQVVLLLVLVLAGAVLLVIGNTIRLATKNRREEIEIIQLIGAPPSFIRRPFLYIGLYYGLFGGLIALIVVNSWVAWLRPTFMQLSALYESQFIFYGVSWAQAAQLLLLSGFLGFLGAWIAVRRELTGTHAGGNKF